MGKFCCQDGRCISACTEINNVHKTGFIQTWMEQAILEFVFGGGIIDGRIEFILQGTSLVKLKDF
jgi:hypothetical protein